MKRVESLISDYMANYEVDYLEAIGIMMGDLETAKEDEELKTNSEDDARDIKLG